MYGIQYLFDGGLRKFMFRQLEVVRLMTWCLFENGKSSLIKWNPWKSKTTNSCFKYTCGIAGNQKTNTPRTELGERISCYNNFFIDLLFTAVKFIFFYHLKNNPRFSSSFYFPNVDGSVVCKKRMVMAMFDGLVREKTVEKIEKKMVVSC
jgi:hypothetical protein